LLGLWLFFTAFNVLEASLPSLMSKLSPLENKGTALGVYSSAQFIGAFFGGLLGGIIYSEFGLAAVFIACAILTLAWLFVVLPMQAPKHYSNRILHIDELTTQNSNKIITELTAIAGVVEAIVVIEEQVAYIKFAADELDEQALDAFQQATT
jgi:MFS family permease